MSWLECWGSRLRGELRLYCFPYAGGAPSAFYGWHQTFSPRIDVCAIQYPGRGLHLQRPPFTRLLPLVEAIVEEALAPHLSTPFAFFGHSMGAIISFEVARYLRRRGGPSPLHLFVSGRRAPQLPGRERQTYDLPEEEFTAELRRLNGTPQEVFEYPELMQLLMPMLRADFEANETYVYRPGPPLDCPITAFGGVEDSEASFEELGAWREQTSAEFSLEIHPGDHFFLNTARSQLARTIEGQLKPGGGGNS